MNSVPTGLYPMPTRFGCCHVLVASDRAVVIDTGLFRARRQFEELFARLRLPPHAVEAIVLTHGHLDHAGNAAWLRDWTGAPILAHPAEQPHLDGTYPYRGASRLRGWLEAAGRALTHYHPVRIDRALHDGELLPWWAGLRVVHLPGHTVGHCGLWSDRHRLLFCGDLVAIWRGWSTFPPFYFNTEAAWLRPSLRRALALDPLLVVPNHYSPAAPFDPADFAERLRRFARRKLRPDHTAPPLDVTWRLDRRSTPKAPAMHNHDTYVPELCLALRPPFPPLRTGEGSETPAKHNPDTYVSGLCFAGCGR